SIFSCSQHFSRLHFSFSDTAPTAIYTLSLHDALPIYRGDELRGQRLWMVRPRPGAARAGHGRAGDRDRGRPAPSAGSSDGWLPGDRKSTRLNSSHVAISYAVFCLKKKNSFDAEQ